jgi:hypothetical protein
VPADPHAPQDFDANTAVTATPFKDVLANSPALADKTARLMSAGGAKLFELLRPHEVPARKPSSPVAPAALLPSHLCVPDAQDPRPCANTSG